MKHRLYVDEVGNSDLGASEDLRHRYLSLTGVGFSLEDVANRVHPELEDLKRRLFGHHPDDPIILHRKALVNKRSPFRALRNPEIEQDFNNTILKMLSEYDYVVITAVIDKLEHKRRYHAWLFDPYHYCMTVILERFVMWLEGKKLMGDVMAESRQGKDDMRLKAAFERIYEQGTQFIERQRFQESLTSKRLKIKPKSKNITGLQLADLIAHPSFKATLARSQGEDLPDNFGGRIARILEDSKYYRRSDGLIEGYGRKILP